MQPSPLKAVRPVIHPLPTTGDSRFASARLLAGAAVLATLSALALLVDLPLARGIEVALSNRIIPGDVNRIVRMAEAFGFGGSVLFIVLVAAVLDPRGWRIVPRLAISAYGAGLTADILKLLIARWRPEHANLEGTLGETFALWLPLLNHSQLAEAGLDYGHKLQSFPSGHAATAAGLAIGLATLYPRGRWLFLVLAALAAFQRIHGQAHFLSDVLAGAAIACLLGAVLAGQNRVARWMRGLELA